MTQRRQIPGINIRNLTVRFSGKAVLKDINLSSQLGQITVIVGPSGSGKSTLLRSINRLNESFPGCKTEGIVEVSINGKRGDIYKDFFPLPELRRKIGMVFQTPTILPFSIAKNLTMPLKLILGLSSTALPERIEWALREVSLWDEVRDRLHAGAHTLSGGQQQRLCLARTLALGPEILLLDEPTASLDFRTAKKIEELLLKLKDRYTVMAVSHSLSQTRRLADKIFVLREGSIVRELDNQLLRDQNLFESLIEDTF